MNTDFVIATYGALVTTILEDVQDPEEANRELDKLGVSIGERMIDEYLASTAGAQRCSQFQQTSLGVISALKSFLGCSEVALQAQPDSQSGAGCYRVLVLDNPLERYVKLPTQLSTLVYSQVVCGAIRGALATLGFNVAVRVEPYSGEQAKTPYGRPTLFAVEMLGEVQEVFTGN